MRLCIFFFNDTATTEIYTLSLHDALPISPAAPTRTEITATNAATTAILRIFPFPVDPATLVHSSNAGSSRSEEHTSELQSRQYLVCRLLLEKKTELH